MPHSRVVFRRLVWELAWLLAMSKTQGLADETGAKTFAVDASDPSAVARLFLDTERLLAEPDFVISNPGYRVSGKLTVLTVAWGMAVEAQSEASRDDLHRTLWSLTCRKLRSPTSS